MNKMPCSITDGPQYDDADMTLASYISETTGQVIVEQIDPNALLSNTHGSNTATNIMEE
jgi:hypothetical protein